VKSLILCWICFETKQLNPAILPTRTFLNTADFHISYIIGKDPRDRVQAKGFDLAKKRRNEHFSQEDGGQNIKHKK
jgi:hypothetical protein